MSRPTKNYKEDLFERLHDQGHAATYLNEAVDEDPKAFLIALKDVTDARGEGVAAIAKKTHLNRESLYHTSSERGNPRLNNLYLTLEALGLHLSITAAVPT